MGLLTLSSKNKRQALNDNDGGGPRVTSEESRDLSVRVWTVDENMNVLQVEHHEEDRTSRLGIEILQDSV